MLDCIHDYAKDLRCIHCGSPCLVASAIPAYVIPAGRADSTALKRKLLDQIFEYWQRAPDLRLGQLIEQAKHEFGDVPDLFYLEDDALGHAVKLFVEKITG